MRLLGPVRCSFASSALRTPARCMMVAISASNASPRRRGRRALGDPRTPTASLLESISHLPQPWGCGRAPLFASSRAVRRKRLAAVGRVWSGGQAEASGADGDGGSSAVPQLYLRALGDLQSARCSVGHFACSSKKRLHRWPCQPEVASRRSRLATHRAAGRGLGAQAVGRKIRWKRHHLGPPSRRPRRRRRKCDRWSPQVSRTP